MRGDRGAAGAGLPGPEEQGGATGGAAKEDPAGAAGGAEGAGQPASPASRLCTQSHQPGLAWRGHSCYGGAADRGQRYPAAPAAGTEDCGNPGVHSGAAHTGAGREVAGCSEKPHSHNAGRPHPLSANRAHPSCSDRSHSTHRKRTCPTH